MHVAPSPGPAAATKPLRLLTIPMSHYCEKARWALAHAGVGYVEEPHLQGFHYLAVRRHGTQVPVLLAGTQVIRDSTAILRYLDRDLPESRKLYPEALQQEVAALEDEYDEHLGVETRRWVYYRWRALPGREVVRTAGQGTPAWERILAPFALPLLMPLLRRHLAVTGGNVDAGLRIIAAGFDAVAARLADGRPFLCGTRFTAADLTFACMAAPVLLPREYGIRLPTSDEAPPAARADIRRFRDHPAGQFALRLYAERRPA